MKNEERRRGEKGKKNVVLLISMSNSKGEKIHGRIFMKTLKKLNSFTETTLKF